MLKKIDLRQAGLINILMNLLAIIVHLLVIFQFMPYNWINGGRSATYEIALQTSINSIPILIIYALISLLASGIFQIKWNNITKIIISILLWIITISTSFGLILQLLGTPFEKFVMSIVCVISIITTIRLAIEKR